MVDTEEPVTLSTSACWHLLQAASLGRLAVAAADGRSPDVFPVNFSAHENFIIFRTAEGAKLSAVDGAFVTLEADHAETSTGIAWSVVAKGRAVEVSLEDEAVKAADRSLFPQHPGVKDHIVRIDVDAISGRRFKTHPPDTSRLSLDEAMRAGLE